MKRILAILALLLFGYIPTAFAATGAVWTTDSTCGGVNINLFASKTDVYLNGGPQGGGGGLPDGNYYVKVTDPSGATLLGITNGATAVVSGGSFDQCYQLVDILYSDSTATPPFQIKGYLDTPNNGGEYKVWVSKDENFSGGTNKTDNFKVEENGGGTGADVGSISGVKWLDSNLDNEFLDEPVIEGWRIELWRYTGEGMPTMCGGEDWMLETTTYTDADGYYYFGDLAIPAYYKVVEVMSLDSECGDWEATTDTCHLVVLTAAPYTAEDQDFGNVCYNTGGLTMGYWKTHVNTGKKGPQIDPVYQAPFSINLCGFGTITNATQAVKIFKAAEASGDGKKMLAGQLLATELNMIKFADCDFAAALYFGNVEGFAGKTVSQIAAAARAILCDSNASKAEVTAMIEVLDQINNNGHEPRVLVNAEPCPVEYPQEP